MIPLMMFLSTALLSASMQIPSIIIISICMVVLYVSALFDLLVFAKWLLLISLLVLSVRALIQYKKTAAPSGLLKAIRHDVALYLVMTGLFFICYSNYSLAIWDEFSHWGTLVKFLYWNHELPGPTAPLAFLEYIPGISLFHYWVISFSQYQEHLLVFSQALVLFSILYVAVHDSSDDQLARRVLAIALTASFIYALNGTFTSLLIDTILGTSWAGIIIYYFRFCMSNGVGKPRFSNLSLAIPLIAFSVLIKASGVFLAYAAVVLISSHFLWTNMRREMGGKSKLLGAMIIAAFFLTPILATKSWDWHMRTEKIPTTINAVKPGIIKKALSSQASQREKLVVELFRKALVSAEPAILHPKIRTVRLSVVGLLVIFAAVIALVWCSSKDQGQKRFLVYINLYLFLFFTLYCLGLLLIFITRFPADNSLGQGSYARYVTTYLYGWGFILIYFSIEALFEDMSANSKRISYVVSFTLIALILILPLKYRKSIRDMRGPLHELALKTKKLPGGSKVWFIQQGSDGFESWIFKYEVMPAKVDIPATSWSIGEKYGEGDVWTGHRTAKTWRDELKGCDYVAIGRADEKFDRQFGALFSDPKINNAAALYEVVKRPGQLFLREVRE